VKPSGGKDSGEHVRVRPHHQLSLAEKEKGVCPRMHTTNLKIFQATPPSLKLRSALSSSRGSSTSRGVRSDQETNKQREHCPPHTRSPTSAHATHPLALRATRVMQGPNLVLSPTSHCHAQTLAIRAMPSAMPINARIACLAHALVVSRCVRRELLISGWKTGVT